mgnify:CR=1 FL=1
MGVPRGRVSELERRTTGILAAAATYIGTVVGAGFASGQEVLQFFGLLGPLGLPAIGLTIAGFAFFGSRVMEAGLETGAESHLPVLRHTAGRLAVVLDVVVTFFLFGAASAMIAGSGSVLRQEFGLPVTVGAGLMALATVATVVTGIRGVVAAISAVVPFLIAGVLIVSIVVLSATGLSLKSPPPGLRPAVPKWPLAGVTYISYNIIMSVPVLAALGSSMGSRRDARRAAALGAAGLGIALAMVYLALVSSFPEVVRYEVPLAHLASSVHALGKPFFVGVFLAEVYTTAVADLYGLAARLVSPASKNFRVTVAIAGALSLWAASAGFTNLVRVVYPAVGWAGLAFLGALALHSGVKPPPRSGSRKRRAPS